MRHVLQRWTPASSLFLKIFLGFWAAMTVAGIVLLALETVRTDRLTQRWLNATSDIFAFYALSAAKDYEERKARASLNFLSDLHQRTGIRSLLLDSRGFKIAGHTASGPSLQFHWNSEVVRDLEERSRQSRTTQFKALGEATLAAHTVQTPSGRYYTLVGELPALRYGPWQARPHIQALRLFSILVVAGLVSWLLGRHLTAPISRLRAATQQLASGNLTARAGVDNNDHGDELAQLASDFDRMAERIESLLQEEARLLQEKENLIEAQRRLLRDVAHELRSPLARLNVALAIARDDLESDDGEVDTGAREGKSNTSSGAQSLPLLDRIEREAQRLGEMINQILELSRLESGVEAAQRVPVNLRELVMTIAADAGFEARPKNRVVGVTYCDDCIVQGIPKLLQSALENIIRNALRYTPENSSVEVELRRTSQTAVVAVRDYGPGVSESQLEEIFWPFYRAEEARERKGGGVGLGLAIAHRAVQLHNGSIRATNVSGGGLRVEVLLPLPEDTAQISAWSTPYALAHERS